MSEMEMSPVESVQSPETQLATPPGGGPGRWGRPPSDEPPDRQLGQFIRDAAGALEGMTQDLEGMGVERAVAEQIRAAWGVRRASVLDAAAYVESGVGEHPEKAEQDPTDEDLERGGLTGEELEAKLAGSEEAIKRWEEARGTLTSPGRLRRFVKRGLGWCKLIVGSLKNFILKNPKVQGALEALEEFMDMVGNVLDDVDASE